MLRLVDEDVALNSKMDLLDKNDPLLKELEKKWNAGDRLFQNLVKLMQKDHNEAERCLGTALSALKAFQAYVDQKKRAFTAPFQKQSIERAESKIDELATALNRLKIPDVDLPRNLL